ncbi:hypothetical protein [Kyrpidia tusciae]|uniref:Uncharacterized protein n=1 Tax=Kyrpidia tusciae (strain DSM 2912 / NBRC 15312 / T2) TaxID=562970 RepID=D5WR10_KYRT2|nr:hypothetical protein [Kyrpidia tusciae]ADG04800.1 hypothetical protein Btus_0020 [Kyrpidia tusciae DSM 2912]
MSMFTLTDRSGGTYTVTEFPDITALSPAEAIAWFVRQVKHVSRLSPFDQTKERRVMELRQWKDAVLVSWLEDVHRRRAW